MIKYYFAILTLLINSSAFAESSIQLNKLSNTNQCIECDFSNLELKGVKFWN